ncbi:NADPH-dependent FMN reductase [Fennellomyces sp. T-0311]|nr:NADPH-dependent FMN reductase [Fennellomyces sp. T-0311]
MTSALKTALHKPYRLASIQNDWVQSLAVKKYPNDPVKILILYGSLRKRSFSRLMAYEFGRILEYMGADVRVFNPSGLPLKDDVNEKHPKVVELRELSMWSDGQVWVSPEQHGQITGVFKTQIDWIPLSLGSVRPTQGKTLAVAQVCGGSQSFNAVNTLRVLGRWMRMFTIPNQSSVPKAWTEFDDDDRMKPSSFRERVVDVAEELYKFTVLLGPQKEHLVDRFSERTEKEINGRLLSQYEKEKAKEKELDELKKIEESK